MASKTISCSAVSELASLLDSPQIKVLIADLDETRWTGRPGYPIRSMIGIVLAKTLYSISTWTKIVALVNEHEALSKVISPDGNIPSVSSCYRFSKKLIEYDYLIEKYTKSILSSLQKKNPEFGKNIAIDASDLPAYANGQKYVSKTGPVREKFSDPDASWGRRSAISSRAAGAFYGYKLHLAVDTATELPLAWTVETGAANEIPFVIPLLDTLCSHGISPTWCAMDRGYDSGPIHQACASRQIQAIIPLRKSPAVVRGDDKPPHCFHGPRVFAGTDYKRKATKWRCAQDMCMPRSVWIKADRLHPLIPRSTDRWKKLYQSRTAVERAFGRLKHEWSMLPLRIRGIKKVKLHIDLTILTKLSCALLKA
jgi:IS5 family transposase